MAWHRTTKDCPFPGPGMHLGSPCASVSQGGVLIPPHRDSEGRNTYFFPVIGIQFRTLFFHKITRDGKVPCQAAKSLCGPHDVDDYNAETLTLYPGDLLIQPPGQLHAEYNPNPALARGGHFFTYGTLHRTHSFRFLEDAQGNTAQAHEYADETVWRMAALIPRLPPDQLSGKLALLASVGTLLHGSQAQKVSGTAPGINIPQHKATHDLTITQSHPRPRSCYENSATPRYLPARLA
ncbi:hypothetical protein DFJ58DRAFT_849821 [Suillus subalutaceus]|uniref:uncharacterized protein n=1 Tax=Suillus subalutaceus TaxID=48586 RepID=UPI001B87A69A|nr:uncharacterized protein DFJ58DRAFT_849821 [Suillus subalutaceus]KAG1823159.1 hypothetical protein DFJ58DRAFT_849821 [Suillus subalutaceus]